MQTNINYPKRSITSSATNIYHDDRINRLSQRLNSIHNGLDIDRSSKYMDKITELEINIKNFDEEMNNRYEISMKKVNELKNSIMNTKIERDMESRKFLNNDLSENIRDNTSTIQIEKRLNELLQSEIFSRKTMEQRLTDIIDERMEKLKTEIFKKDLERKELDSCVKKFVDIDIPRLGNAIKNEIDKCQSIEINILNQLKEEIEKLNVIINNEVNTRQQSIDALLDLMENLVQQITLDTRNDRSERQNSEDTLLKLLEDTLNRVQSVMSTILKS